MMQIGTGCLKIKKKKTKNNKEREREREREREDYIRIVKQESALCIFCAKP